MHLKSTFKNESIPFHSWPFLHRHCINRIYLPKIYWYPFEFVFTISSDGIFFSRKLRYFIKKIASSPKASIYEKIASSSKASIPYQEDSFFVKRKKFLFDDFTDRIFFWNKRSNGIFRFLTLASIIRITALLYIPKVEPIPLHPFRRRGRSEVHSCRRNFLIYPWVPFVPLSGFLLSWRLLRRHPLPSPSSPSLTQNYSNALAYN